MKPGVAAVFGRSEGGAGVVPAPSDDAPKLRMGSSWDMFNAPPYGV